MAKSRYSLGYVEDGYEPFHAMLALDKWVELVSFESSLSLREAIKKSLSFIRDEYLKKAPKTAIVYAKKNRRPDSLSVRKNNLKFIRLCCQSGVRRDKFPSTAIVIKGLDIFCREFKRLLSVSSDERLFSLVNETIRN
ncbi:MAG: hypothetical protein Q8R26_02470 [bacterium]|nr:hypothetical protein [bacterium]